MYFFTSLWPSFYHTYVDSTKLFDDSEHKPIMTGTSFEVPLRSRIVDNIPSSFNQYAVIRPRQSGVEIDLHNI